MPEVRASASREKREAARALVAAWACRAATGWAADTTHVQCAKARPHAAEMAAVTPWRPVARARATAACAWLAVETAHATAPRLAARARATAVAAQIRCAETEPATEARPVEAVLMTVACAQRSAETAPATVPSLARPARRTAVSASRCAGHVHKMSTARAGTSAGEDAATACVAAIPETTHRRAVQSLAASDAPRRLRTISARTTSNAVHTQNVSVSETAEVSVLVAARPLRTAPPHRPGTQTRRLHATQETQLQRVICAARGLGPAPSDFHAFVSRTVRTATVRRETFSCKKNTESRRLNRIHARRCREPCA